MGYKKLAILSLMLLLLLPTTEERSDDSLLIANIKKYHYWC
jgi:hypothetical protein